MIITVARHAWGYERNAERWPDDSLRELTPEGEARYSEMIRILVERGVAPQRIATSPYMRCVQTAQIIANLSPDAPEIVAIDSLEPDSDIEALFQWTVEQGVDSICWVGHAPDVTYLTAALIGEPEAGIRFAKGAIAEIRIDEPIGLGLGELRFLATAKLLGV